MNTTEISEILSGVWVKVAEFAPNLIAALLILIFGFFVSKIIQKLATALLRKLRLDQASQSVGLEETLRNGGFEWSAAAILGKIIFWLFMLIFLISAADTLGLDNVSRTIDSLVGYLPNVIAAALMVVGGMLLAHFVGRLVRTGAEGIGVEYGKPLSKLAHTVVMIVMVTLAVDQLGIETALVSRVIEIVLITAGAAMAIALGFGSQDIAKNIIAGLYARDIYTPSAKVKVGEAEGIIEAIGIVNTTIGVAQNSDQASPKSMMHVPNIQLINEIVVRESEEPSPD